MDVILTDRLPRAPPTPEDRGMSQLKLYELTNANGASTSPFVWRVKFVLQAKGLAYESRPVSFLDIQHLARTVRADLKTVPILERDGMLLNESWAIVVWLDQTYPDLPPIFSSTAELAMVKFFDKWFGTQILPLMFRSCALEIHEHLRREEQAYFRSSRELMLGRAIEDVAAYADIYLARMREAFLPVRLALRHAPYLGGEQPNYADFIAWSAFLAFAPVVSKPLLTPDDTLRAWLARGAALAGEPRRSWAQREG